MNGIAFGLTNRTQHVSLKEDVEAPPSLKDACYGDLAPNKSQADRHAWCTDSERCRKKGEYAHTRPDGLTNDSLVVTPEEHPDTSAWKVIVAAGGKEMLPLLPPPPDDIAALVSTGGRGSGKGSFRQRGGWKGKGGGGKKGAGWKGKGKGRGKGKGARMNFDWHSVMGGKTKTGSAVSDAPGTPTSPAPIAARGVQLRATAAPETPTTAATASPAAAGPAPANTAGSEKRVSWISPVDKLLVEASRASATATDTSGAEAGGDAPPSTPRASSPPPASGRRLASLVALNIDKSLQATAGADEAAFRDASMSI